tara:strand:+ start:259 stop:999 length:741 start_codon:yes stop_codon:yes gene_type:complete
MKILVLGCSWIQKMNKQNHLLKFNINRTHSNTIDVEYLSFPGQGLWTIAKYLRSLQEKPWFSGSSDFDKFDAFVIQLPTPIRNEENSTSTTNRFKMFIKQIKELGEIKASKKILDEYKEKIIEISKLGKKVVFFLYNVGGYPFRHPYDFGIDIDDKMVEFFRDNGLEHLYLSFEGKEGYGVKEEDCEDEEFWEFYHENNPANRKSKDFKKYWSIISPKGVISIDPHPNEKANKIALKLIEDYFIGE